MRFLRTTTIPSADEDEDARREEQQRESEEQIAATLSNIQLSRGVEELVDGEEFTKEDVEQLEEVLDGCDNEYKNLFATLDQLGSCLDEVGLVDWLMDHLVGRLVGLFMRICGVCL